MRAVLRALLVPVFTVAVVAAGSFPVAAGHYDDDWSGTCDHIGEGGPNGANGLTNIGIDSPGYLDFAIHAGILALSWSTYDQAFEPLATIGYDSRFYGQIDGVSLRVFCAALGPFEISTTQVETGEFCVDMPVDSISFTDPMPWNVTTMTVNQTYTFFAVLLSEGLEVTQVDGSDTLVVTYSLGENVQVYQSYSSLDAGLRYGGELDAIATVGEVWSKNTDESQGSWTAGSLTIWFSCSAVVEGASFHGPGADFDVIAEGAFGVAGIFSSAYGPVLAAVVALFGIITLTVLVIRWAIYRVRRAVFALTYAASSSKASYCHGCGKSWNVHVPHS